MQINRLFKEMWDVYEEQDNAALMKWIEIKVKRNPKSIDINYAHLEVLTSLDFDNDRERREPAVIELCTEIIRNPTENRLNLAKAYAFRGEMKYLAVDRRKDFDKARAILAKLKKTDPQVKFLNQFVDAAYPLARREYLFMDFQTFRNQI